VSGARTHLATRWLGVTARRLVADLVPTLVLVTLLGSAAWLSPRIGGPSIRVPNGQIDYAHAAYEGLVWGVLSLLTALFVSRCRALWRARKGRVDRLSPPLEGTSRTLLRSVPRALSVAGGLALIRITMPIFIGFKRAIPEVHAYGPSDQLLIRADRMLHFGHDPWRLLQPLLGRPFITATLDAFYYGWYFVSVLGFVALTFWTRGEQRTRFVLSFAATWVFLGIGVAALTASVGPTFLDQLGQAPTPFSPLEAYLRSVNVVFPLRALEIQQELWTAYLGGYQTLTSGIAAMPSLHVAIPALFAVAVAHRSRAVFIAMSIYTGIILLGSVHLGWHYALDGYVSIALVNAVWWIAGKVSSAWHARLRRSFARTPADAQAGVDTPREPSRETALAGQLLQS
jgi:hypothetical protein